MNLQIERGRALVLSGPQGCGKTRKAHELAKRAGKFVELTMSDLADRAILNNALRQKPKTVIVEADSIGRVDRETLKHLVTANTVKVRQPYGGGYIEAQMPNFIFCTCEPDAFRSMGDRRFHVVDLGR